MDIKFIKQIPLFSNLSDEKAQIVMDVFQIKSYKAGDVVFKQGQTGKGMYGIIFGEVEVVIDGKVKAKLGNNDFFGEMALIGFEKRNATVKAISELSAFYLSKGAFNQIKEELGRGVSDEIMRRIREDYEEM